MHETNLLGGLGVLKTQGQLPLWAKSHTLSHRDFLAHLVTWGDFCWGWAAWVAAPFPGDPWMKSPLCWGSHGDLCWEKIPLGKTVGTLA